MKKDNYPVTFDGSSEVIHYNHLMYLVEKFLKKNDIKLYKTKEKLKINTIIEILSNYNIVNGLQKTSNRIFAEKKLTRKDKLEFYVDNKYNLVGYKILRKSR